MVPQAAGELVKGERLGVTVQKRGERGVGGDSLSVARETSVALDVAEDRSEDLGPTRSGAATKESRKALGDAALCEGLVVGSGVAATSVCGVRSAQACEVDEHGVLGREEGAGGLLPVIGLGGVRDGDGGSTVPADQALDGDPVLGVRSDAEEGGTGWLPVLFQGRAVGEVGVADGVVVLLGDQPRVAVAPALDRVNGAIEFALGWRGGNTVPLPRGILGIIDLCGVQGLAVVPEHVAENAGSVSGGDGGGEGGLVDQEGGSHFGFVGGVV